MRLFTGVKFESNIIRSLCCLQSAITKRAGKARLVSKDNLHLTLFFLGKTSENKLDEVRQTLKTVGEWNAPFTLKLNNRLETFDAKNPAKVVWVGVQEGLPALQRLQQAIASAMEKAGFKGDGRTYVPHITVARDVYFKNATDTGCEEGIGTKIEPIPAMAVDNFELIASEIKNGRRVYRTIAVFFLKNN